ncbi:hypothetical protein [Legionella fairfieldensis]|uniref:hypothetical protein n=1 Tax=Legionella fairfieldensis TaxID=45064 RepID=UPI00048C0CD8|nr:hypothetical protein [Legionella fairfieldensis]
MRKNKNDLKKDSENESQRPPLAAMACDAKRFLGLRTDIRQLINVNNPPSRDKSISKTLHHPVLDELHKKLLRNLRRNTR